MKTYRFSAHVELEDDGRWSAWVESLPGCCAAGGYPRDEALSAVRDAAEAYLADMIEAGEPVPAHEPEVDSPLVTVRQPST